MLRPRSWFARPRAGRSAGSTRSWCSPATAACAFRRYARTGWRAELLIPTRAGMTVWPLGGLEEDLGGDLGRAALSDELDSRMEISVTVREPLGEGERIARLHQHVQS